MGIAHKTTSLFIKLNERILNNIYETINNRTIGS